MTKEKFEKAKLILQKLSEKQNPTIEEVIAIMELNNLKYEDKGAVGFIKRNLVALRDIIDKLLEEE